MNDRPSLILFAIASLACQSGGNRGLSNSSDSTTSFTGRDVIPERVRDTAVVFHKHSRDYRAIIDKQFPELIKDFQAFLDSHLSDSLEYDAFELVDVTGDGVPDSCRSRIHFVNGLPLIDHTIRSGGVQIWRDTLTVPDDVAELFGWADSTTFQNLKPHSAFYNAIRAGKHFVRGKVDPSSAEYGYFLHVYHSDDPESWDARYKSFPGHWIVSNDLSDETGFVWDTVTQKFIPYYGN